MQFPIVGAKYRPPASLILGTVLFSGHPLRLQREPSNPHDANAIMVVLDKDTLTDEQRSQVADLFEVSGETMEQDDRIHLGYLPREIAAEYADALDVIDDEDILDCTFVQTPEGGYAVEWDTLFLTDDEDLEDGE